MAVLNKKQFVLVCILCLMPALVTAQSKAPKQTNPETAANIEDENLRKAAELFELGQSAHQRGEFEKALEHYAAALKYDSSLWQIELQLSLANLALGRLGPARTAIESVLTQLAQYANTEEKRQFIARSQIVFGEVALAGAKLEDAEKAFRQALTFNPLAPQAQAGLAEVMFAKEKYAEAVQAAQKAIELGDTRLTTRLLLTDALMRAQRFDEALSSLNEVLKAEPLHLPALRQHAQILARQNDYEGAIRDLLVVVKTQPQLSDQLLLASLYIQVKRYDQALTLYRQISNENPANVEAQRALAGLMLESGKDQEAIGQLEALLKTAPDDATLRAQLGELYLATNPEKALEQYSAAARLAPENASSKIGVAAALVKLRRFQEAVPLLRGVLAENPKDEIGYFAHTNLATALFELNDFASAALEFSWILNHQQNRQRAVVALYFLGICFDKLGDYEQALKVYEQFLKLAGAENQLEIDKVKLRLPPLQRQIREGQGKRKKK
jgi:tetratricopeptide (TPR) repeat protein